MRQSRYCFRFMKTMGPSHFNSGLFLFCYTVILLVVFYAFCPRNESFLKNDIRMEQYYHKDSKVNFENNQKTSSTFRPSALFTGLEIREAPFVPDVSSEDIIIKWDGGPFCEKWAVVTTIFEPSDSVRLITQNRNWCLVIVGDTKTESEESYLTKLGSVDKKRTTFLSPAKQNELYPDLSAAIEWKCFQRKNVGYMYAIHHGAKFVWDFDDDNKGIIDLDILRENNRYQTVCSKYEAPLFNPYPYFGVNETYTWPRGFPLQEIRNRSLSPKLCETIAGPNTRIGVVQSLANIQPDVDGVYRLTRDTPFNFRATSETHKPVLVPLKSYTPFNGQASLWTSLALEYLALPVSVHPRVTDIYRSYIAENILYNTGIQILFSVPYVDQFRNPHDYLVDFNDEMDIYEKSKQMIDFLWRKNPSDNMESLYVELYRRSYIDISDIKFIKVWSKTFENAKKEAMRRASQ